MENAGYFGYGYISSEEELVPPVGLVYWAFRVMVGLGCFLLLVMILAFYYVERRETLEKNRWFRDVLSIPLVLPLRPGRLESWQRSEGSRGQSRVCCR